MSAPPCVAGAHSPQFTFATSEIPASCGQVRAPDSMTYGTPSPKSPREISDSSLSYSFRLGTLPTSRQIEFWMSHRLSRRVVVVATQLFMCCALLTRLMIGPACPWVPIMLPDLVPDQELVISCMKCCHFQRAQQISRLVPASCPKPHLPLRIIDLETSSPLVLLNTEYELAILPAVADPSRASFCPHCHQTPIKTNQRQQRQQ